MTLWVGGGSTGTHVGMLGRPFVHVCNVSGQECVCMRD